MTLWFIVRSYTAILRRKLGLWLLLVFLAFGGALWTMLAYTWLAGNYRAAQGELAKIRIDAMLVPEASEWELATMLADVRRSQLVSSARIIESTQVWEEFSAETGVSHELLGVVTVPRILRISVHPDKASATQLAQFASSVYLAHNHICTEVVWPRAFVQVADKQKADLVSSGVVIATLTGLLFLLGGITVLRMVMLVARVHVDAALSVGSAGSSAVLPFTLLTISSVAVGIGCAVAVITAIVEWYPMAWQTSVSLLEPIYCSLALLAVVVVVTWLYNSITAMVRANTRRMQ